MIKNKLWYTLERANGLWTIWLNKEGISSNHGSGGCDKVYSSTEKNRCLDYCKKNKIKIEKRNK